MKKYYHQVLNNINFIIDELIYEFGNEYENHIRYVVNNLKVVFESLPDENCNAILYGYDRGNLLIEYKNYLELEHSKKQIFDKYLKKNLDYFISCFIDLNDQKDYRKIYKYFTTYELETSLIDYFSTKNIQGKVSDEADQAREKFINLIIKSGYKIKYIDPNVVDSFIYWRDQLARKIMYQQLIFNNNTYIIELTKLINDDCLDIVMGLNYQNNPCCYKYYKNNGYFNSFIYLPINHMKMNHSKAIDLIFIHELIHFIQKYSNDQSIINEVFVQYKAIQIVNRLHNKGVYLFDYVDDVKACGECMYEELIPYISILLENVPSEVLNNSIIDSNYQQLGVFFGNSIYEYLQVLDQLFDDLRNNANFRVQNINKYHQIITQMINYYLNSPLNSGKKKILNK